MRTLIIAVVLLGTTRAFAYPQFQLSKDQTCSDCHLSPAGGGPLSENGLNTADAISQFSGAPEFLHNLLPLPKWLTLGGDLRAATGLDNAAAKAEFALFPMQFELYANAQVSPHVSLHATLGLRDPQQETNTGQPPPPTVDNYSTLVFSREHWVQWQENPGETNGMFLRVGRMMPVYGLRLVEHPDYDRRFGGTPLYDETYGAAADYIQPRWEFHATAFIHDPIVQSSIEQGNGVAVYTECRPTETSSVGLEGMFVEDPDDVKGFYGVTAKHMFGDQLLLEGELQGVHQKVDAGGVANQAIAYVLGSYFLKTAFMVDVGLGYYNENVAIKGLDRDLVDLNIHWFTTSHIELILTNRFQMIEFGSGGNASYYSLLQIHYRL